jgi:hypothetical protein
MGDRPYSVRSSGLRLLLRLLSVVAALFVLSVSGRAAAATIPIVPMCGEHAESIAAPPIFRAYQLGSIVAAPCHADGLELGTSAPLAPERIVVRERPERVLGFSAFCLSQSASSRLSIVDATRVPAPPGFVDSLFRPPRA